MAKVHWLRPRDATIVLALALALSLTACGSGTGEEGVGDLSFTVEGFEFPKSLEVDAGGTVTVTNADPEPHTVTADDGSFETDSIAPNSEVTLVAPEEPGSYPFVCTIHSSMSGTLEVR